MASRDSLLSLCGILMETTIFPSVSWKEAPPREYRTQSILIKGESRYKLVRLLYLAVLLDHFFDIGWTYSGEALEILHR